MIIENLTNEELVFRANGKVLRLKAGINNIESALSTPEEIKRHFGNYVNVRYVHELQHLLKFNNLTKINNKFVV